MVDKWLLWLVTPPVSTGLPLNKRHHPDMTSYTSLCFNLLLEGCTLLFHIQLKQGGNVSSGELCDLGIQFGSMFSVNIITAACFQRKH